MVASPEQMSPAAAMGWLLLALVGWLLVIAGFPSDADPAANLSANSLSSLRIAGLAALVLGVVGAVRAGIHLPVVLMVGGMLLNIAVESGAIGGAPLGVLGAFSVLVGTLWASRRAREVHRMKVDRATQTHSDDDSRS